MMKITAIAQIMKSSHMIYLCKDNEEQYITNGHALYSLNNLPSMDKDQLCAILGIPDGKKGKYNIEDNKPVPEIVKANINNWNSLKRENLLIKYLGEIYEPIKLNTGIVFINVKYLKPFSDLEEISLYDYYDILKGQRTIIVKAGLIFVGAIEPENIVTDNLFSTLNEITNRVKNVIDNEKYKRRVEYTEEQQTFNIQSNEKEGDE